jgi:hypothetical protein
MIEAGGSPLIDPPIGVFEKVRKAEEDQVAFWTACYDGDEHSVHRLIGKVDVNKGFKDGNSGVDDVHALIKDGKVDLSKAGHDGWTPLHTAIGKGRSGVVRVLLGSGMVKDGDLHHAIRHATYKGHVDIVRALLDAGADTTKTMKSNDTYNGMTAREIATERGHERIVRVFDEAEKAHEIKVLQRKLDELQRKLDESEKEKKRLQREEMDAADGLARLDPGPKKVKKRNRLELKNLNDKLSDLYKVTGPRREDSKITWK